MTTLDNSLAGQVFAITGKLKGFTRREAITALESKGGVVKNGVSKRTTALIADNHSFSKSYTKAILLGIPIKTTSYIRGLIQ